MAHSPLPTHSISTLIKATLSALVFAAVLLITVILPSEYNIDPTGVGQSLGLTQLAASEVKGQPAAVPIDIVAAAKTPIEQTSEVEIVVPANRGIEYKLLMKQFEQVDYQWKTANGEALYFDLHGEPEGDTTGYYKSYTIATAPSAEGSFSTPFTGSHGWYWKNTSSDPVTVTLSLKGQYEIKG